MWLCLPLYIFTSGCRQWGHVEARSLCAAFSSIALHLIGNRVSHWAWSLLIWLDWPANKLWRSSVSASPTVGPHGQLGVWMLGVEISLHAFTSAFWQPSPHSLEMIFVAFIYPNPLSVWHLRPLLTSTECSSFSTHLSHTFSTFVPSVSLPHRLLLPLFSSLPTLFLLSVGDYYSVYLLWEWDVLDDFIHPHDSEKSQVSSQTMPLTTLIPTADTCPAVSAPLIYRMLVLFLPRSGHVCRESGSLS